MSQQRSGGSRSEAVAPSEQGPAQPGTVARQDVEFGVTWRELAVGGQALSIRGLAGEYRDLLLTLFGEYQAANAACALAAVEAFGGAGPDAGALSEDLVREAFAAMTSPGRLEVVRRSPVVIADSAHNRHAHRGRRGNCGLPLLAQRRRLQ